MEKLAQRSATGTRRLPWLILCLGLLVGLGCNLVSGGSQPDAASATPTLVIPAAPSTGVAISATPATAATVSANPSLLPSGPVYHVAVNETGASDENNGYSPTSLGGKDGPWLTIAHAAETLMPGESAFIHPGVYEEAGIRFARSGEKDQPIMLLGEGPATVILDGSKAKGRSSGIEISPGQGYIVIQGLTIRNMPRSGITALGETDTPYSGITIKDCTLQGNGLDGIRLAAVDGFLIDNVAALDNGNYGLDVISSEDGAISSSNGIVQNSKFYNHTGDEGHGLAVNQGHDIQIIDNQVYHNRIHGVDVSDWPKKGDLSYNITLEGNLSYDNGVAGFSINSDSHHVIYRNNIAYGNGAEWAGRGASSGFLCYEGCWHIEYDNNTSVNNSDAGFWIQADLGLYSSPGDSLLLFKNNLAYQNGRPGDEIRAALVIEGPVWEVVAEHNNWGGVPGLDALVVGIHIVNETGEIYRTSEIQSGAFQIGNVSLDPLFVDLILHDYRLRPESAMIDAGVDLGFPYCGRAPDLGAIEYCP